MAAGLGFKTFTTGEVLTAADVNGYLMQGILVFATEAARNSAITSPQEGQFAFTKDTNTTWFYTGSAWVTSGGGGLTLLSTTNLTGSSTQITVTANSYSLLLISIEDYYFSTAASFKARLNANTGSVYGQNYFDAPNATTPMVQAQNFISLYSGSGGTDANNDNAATIMIENPNAATNKLGTTIGTAGTGQYLTSGMFVYDDSAVISSVTVFPNSGTFSGGSVKIYGA